MSRTSLLVNAASAGVGQPLPAKVIKPPTSVVQPLPAKVIKPPTSAPKPSTEVTVALPPLIMRGLFGGAAEAAGAAAGSTSSPPVDDRHLRWPADEPVHVFKDPMMVLRQGAVDADRGYYFKGLDPLDMEELAPIAPGTR